MQTPNTLSRVLDLRQIYALNVPSISELDLSFTKNEKHWLKIMTLVFLAEVAISALLIIPSVQMYFMPNRVQASVVEPVHTPPLTRPEFTGAGTMRVMDVGATTTVKQSVQVFEYSDPYKLHAEAAAFRAKYATRSIAPLVHVYESDSRIALYVGNSKDAVSALDAEFK